MKNEKRRTAIGFAMFITITLLISFALPKYKPRSTNPLTIENDSLRKEIWINEDVKIRMQMKLKYLYK